VLPHDHIKTHVLLKQIYNTIKPLTH
jgi:hypothetical protein